MTPIIDDGEASIEAPSSLYIISSDEREGERRIKSFKDAASGGRKFKRESTNQPSLSRPGKSKKENEKFKTPRDAQLPMTYNRSRAST